VTTTQAVVDSHTHVWDTDRFDYPWLQGFTELNGPFVPPHPDVGDVLIEGLIFVQANPVGDAP
jgi:L-fuconolactonase